MQPDTARVCIDGRSRDRLQELVGPVRERLEESVRDLSHALARAGESVKRIRVADVMAIMRRSPLASLAVAAGIGFLVGLSLWARDE
ncbi:MAG TPA: hypothetical protein VKV41_09825 [Methylomirabilota bacterium]|jgi:ElaB/YqjD/DUF883 family membrane-anchored ribosome-binding protein|nr:hypothetical protein [Methylomirabilota bacterium]